MILPLVILGTGGSAYDVLDIVEAINRAAPTWEPLGFLDDAKPVGSRHLELPILGLLADAGNIAADALFINVIGSDKSFRHRPAIIGTSSIPDARFATLIHPLASISSRAALGRGVYAGPGSSVGGGVRIGNHVAISPGAIVGHDSVIEDYAMLAPGSIVSGFCRIGRAAYIGAGALIRQNVRVNQAALVGMGAVVLNEVEPEAVVVGNPAQILAKNSELSVRRLVPSGSLSI